MAVIGLIQGRVSRTKRVTFVQFLKTLLELFPRGSLIIEPRCSYHERYAGVTSETNFQAIVYNGLVVYGPALAMSQCAGMDLNVSILVVGLTCLFYTVIGGMKAVIWTDVWQTLWMIRKEY